MQKLYLKYVLSIFLLPLVLFAQESDTTPFRGNLAVGLGGGIRSKGLVVADSTIKPTHMKFTFGAFTYFAPHYMNRVDFVGFTIVDKDPYNNYKSHLSLLSLFNIFWYSKGFENMDPGELDWKNPFILVPTLLNSTHYLLFSKPQFEEKGGLKGLNTAALFLKNETQLYLFRRTKWIRISPPAGIALLTDLFVAEAGISESFEITVDKVSIVPYVYLSVVLATGLD